MSNLSIEEAKLKDLFKSVIVEILEERGDLIRELLEEAIEDIALARAIEEGMSSPTVSRAEVFEVLEGGQ